MLYKFGIIATAIILGYKWVLAQADTVLELRDFIDAGFTVVTLWVFIYYLWSKEKRYLERLEQKDKQIQELNDKLNGK